jgi:hypothetical protein
MLPPRPTGRATSACWWGAHRLLTCLPHPLAALLQSSGFVAYDSAGQSNMVRGAGASRRGCQTWQRGKGTRSRPYADRRVRAHQRPPALWPPRTRGAAPSAPAVGPSSLSGSIPPLPS